MLAPQPSSLFSLPLPPQSLNYKNILCHLGLRPPDTTERYLPLVVSDSRLSRIIVYLRVVIGTCADSPEFLLGQCL